MKKIVLGVLVLVIVALSGAGLYYQREIDRATFVASWFTGAEQFKNFNRLVDMYPVASMRAAAVPYEFPEGPRMKLPIVFEFEGATVSTEAFMEETDTVALLVLKDGEVRFEKYLLTGARDVKWLSMSVSKSFVSAAIGIAVHEGLIESIEEPITRYLPSLMGSAYDGVRIKDVLQMSSGARWNEDYSDRTSDIFRLGIIMAIGGSFDALVATVEREHEPGTRNHYNSADTHALGMLLVSATGRSIADYMEEKLWQPLGMEADGYWMVDDEKMELAFGGLNATARDYAKLGELYLNGGMWHGNQIVPSSWVHASVTPDAPHLTPEGKAKDPYPVGYGYQWWVPEGDEGEYLAIGIYNQFIYVNPAQDLVIVKLSAFNDYGVSLEDAAYREIETFEFFRAIGDALELSPTLWP